MKTYEFRVLATVSVEAYEFTDALAAIDDVFGVGEETNVTVQDIEVYER